jgi:hypothetical protein
LDSAGKRVVQRHITACYRSCTGSAIGLKDIAVDNNLALTERFHIADTAQGPTNEALDLVGSARRRSLAHFASHTLRGSSGQH